MSDEKIEDEVGLTEEELEEVTGGAGAALAAKGIRTITSVKALPGGGSAIHIKSAFGQMPGGGKTIVKGA